MIYGKLAGTDREHTAVGQSKRWPSGGGVPRCVGVPSSAGFQGACALDWYNAGAKRLLALSWCEIGPRITSREFIQSHHIVAPPQDFAPALPFLPEMVAQMRQIPVFDKVDPALRPFVFTYPACNTAWAAQEEWFCANWQRLSLLLAAVLEGGSVYVHCCAGVETKLQIVAALMRILPPHARPGLTFSTDEFERHPCPRHLTFAYHRCANVVIAWEESLAKGPTHPATNRLVAQLGRILANQGLAALVSEVARPEYRHLTLGVPGSASQLLALRFPSAV